MRPLHTQYQTVLGLLITLWLLVVHLVQQVDLAWAAAGVAARGDLERAQV
jgi:hypothetical protein